MTYTPTPPTRLAHSVGYVGYLFSIANIANKPQFIQWCTCIQYCMGIQYVQTWLVDVVGIANMTHKYMRQCLYAYVLT